MTARVKVPGWFKPVPEGAVYVGRAVGGFKRSPYANPYPVKTHGLTESLRLFRERTLPTLDLTELRGHDLACWCPLDAECHADILIEEANR